MSFLAKSEIRNRQEELFREGFDDKCVQQASYDLRLGSEAYVVGKKAPERLTERSPFLILPPGQFAILTSLEVMALSRKVMGLITLRNRYKMQGLVNVSGFHVDPTFQGKLLFGVQNVGPSDVRLKYGDRTFTIFFTELTGDIGEDRKDVVPGGIRLEDIQHFGGSSLTLSKLKRDLDNLRTLMLVYAPFAVAATVALIVALIKGMGKL